MSVLRFQIVTNVLHGGNTLAHGLPGTPNEYAFTQTLAPALSGGIVAVTAVYFAGVSSTNIVVATAGAGGNTGLVTCSIPHSIIA